MTKLERARIYLARGWCPIPVEGKNPQHLGKGWQAKRFDDAALARYFKSNGHESSYNIGNTLGDASGGLVDVDLDHTLAQPLAEYLLDRTDAVFGRPGKPRSHRLYLCPMPVPNTKEFLNPVGDGNIAELRGSNGQTVFPGSRHVDTGEMVEWDEDGDPAPGDWDVLLDQVGRVCAGVLLVPRWGKGTRHKMTLALAGALLRRGWDTLEVIEYITAIAQAAPPLPDNDFVKLARDVKDTEARRKTTQTTGIPTLASLVQDERAMAKIIEWLRLGPDPNSSNSSNSYFVPPGQTGDGASPGGPNSSNSSNSYFVTQQEERTLPPLDDAALYGLAGDVVRTLAPETEACAPALLVTLLVMVGNAIGRGPHALVGRGSRHGTNLNVTLVGRTAGGRKGTSRAEISALMALADGAWTSERVQSGLSSGEGLIHAVRDRQTRMSKEMEEIEIDPGVTDKRLLVIEEEFCAPIKLMAKEGNILSAKMREAWDGRDLGTLTRNNALHATQPHISVLGHATKDELLKYLTETEMGDGFANRFLWCMTEMSRQLPDGGAYIDLQPLADRLRLVLDYGRKYHTTYMRDNAAKELWHGLYPQLLGERTGLFGAVTSRAEAQCLRLSVIYAVLDQVPDVRLPHLQAAYAVWQYCQESARRVFGDKTGDNVADRIRIHLRCAGGAGLTTTGISERMGRNVKADRLHSALDRLLATGLAVAEPIPGSSPPAVIYRAV